MKTAEQILKEIVEGYNIPHQDDVTTLSNNLFDPIEKAREYLQRPQQVLTWGAQEKLGNVRLDIVPDNHTTFEGYEGDMFAPSTETCTLGTDCTFGHKCHEGHHGLNLPCDYLQRIPADELKRHRNNARARVNRLGFFGIIGQVRGGGGWIDIDSVWGFVGDDWKGSGYDDDIKRATLDHLATLTRCEDCGRTL